MKRILLLVSKIGNLILSFFNLAMFFAIRMCWSGISKTLGYEQSESNFILLLPVFIFFILIGLFVLNILIYKFKKDNNPLAFIMNGINILFFIGIMVIIALGADDYMYFAWPYFIKYCLIALGVLIGYFFIFIYPKTNLKNNKIFTYISFGLIITITIGYLVNAKVNYIICNPVVYIVEDKYQIVFASNTESRAWVKIGETEYYDNYAGSNRSYTKVHKIEVPITEMNQHKEYTINTQKLTYRGPFGGFKGRLISETFEFQPVDTSDGLDYYAISDIHMDIKSSKLAVDYNTKKELIVIGGDVISMIETEDDALYTNKVAHELTKGRIPVIYARGNHEIKGKYSEEFHKYVGAKNEDFYYTFKFDNVYGMVLDIGEDHDDDYWEYYDTAYFNEYRNEQVKMIQNEIAKGDYKNYDYRLVISHIPLPFINKNHNHEQIKNELNNLLNQMNINMVISGHQHELMVFDPKEVAPNEELTYNINYDCKGEQTKGYLLDFNYPSFTVSKRGYTQTDDNDLIKVKSQIGLNVYVDFNNKIQECTFNNSRGDLVNIVNPFKDINYGTTIKFSLETNTRI